ncbi:hypothetical protein TNCV_4072211 [Trichonephila clavipes]|uniref:Uncharacterized protein n=1 Tax=Trichonephila clavipes TaxID=2585209 RepID=A0A8X6W7X0_TRICX|nr:hypothetical protein TNCV_4072211 [Trichonephila clavipes]
MYLWRITRKKASEPGELISANVCGSFGSPCYAHVPAQKRRKIDKKAFMSILPSIPSRAALWDMMEMNDTESG